MPGEFCLAVDLHWGDDLHPAAYQGVGGRTFRLEKCGTRRRKADTANAGGANDPQAVGDDRQRRSGAIQVELQIHANGNSSWVDEQKLRLPLIAIGKMREELRSSSAGIIEIDH